MTFVPSEEQMRSQMFLTMQAAEDAFKSISAYLGGRSVGETISRAVDQDDASGAYAALQVICKECDGIAVFKDYERRYHDPEDTCKCSHITLDEFNVSPEVAAIYRAVHADRAAKHHCYCGKPGNPGPHKKNGLCGCPSCHGEIEDADCICPEKVFESDVIIEGTRTATVSRSEVDDLWKVVEAHSKALALLTTHTRFNHFTAITGLREEIKRHVGRVACSQCPGTGWVSRDERCQSCRGKGFVNL
jgi:hypothetical protein